jgi:thiol-disulfide isomerase/thioredoxin
MSATAVKRSSSERTLDHLQFASAPLALCLVLAMSTLGTAVRAEDAAELSEAKPFVVKIHADWCGTCRMLEPTWLKIQSELGDRAHLVKFDVSDRAAAEQSQAEAERLGLSEFYRKYRASTGTIGVLDGRTFEPVAILRGERDLSKYREAVEKAQPSS